jgi:hypothetical protein
MVKEQDCSPPGLFCVRSIEASKRFGAFIRICDVLDLWIGDAIQLRTRL